MDLLDTLKEIHRETISRFTYVSDKQNYNMREHWPSPRQLPNYPNRFKGDCDDFALMCRKELKKKAIPNRLVFCLTENGGGHLVCSVEGWILDNRCTTVARRDDLPYTWISISNYRTGEPWHRISNG